MMMTWSFWHHKGVKLLVAAFLSLSCTHATVSDPPKSQPQEVPHVEAAPTATLRPLLWRAESDHGRLYLFGTMHAGVRARSEMPAIIWQLMKESPCFVMETDLDTAPSLQAELTHYMTLPAGDSLDKHLSPAAWRALKERFKERYAEADLKQLRPWVLASEFMQDQFAGGELMDQELKKLAVRERDRIHYLEKVTEQLAVVSKVVSFADLESLIMHGDELGQLSEEMLKAYRAGNAESLQHMVEDEKAGLSNTPEQLELLLYARNRQWVPKLEAFSRGDTCFVAVGAGHLLGERGLVSLLAKQGYRVQRLP